MKHECGKIRLLLFTILLLIVSIICFYESTKSNSNDYTEEESTNTDELFELKSLLYKAEDVVNETQTQHIDDEKKIIKFQDKMSIDWDSEDAYLLAKIAMAEAEGESTEGKALVMLVVLNRMLDDTFPDTISEVIFQHNGDIYQFSPVGNGRFDNVEPNEDCWEALDLIYSGWDESKGALYFESCKTNDTWHSRNLEFLFEYGGHRFYK